MTLPLSAVLARRLRAAFPDTAMRIPGDEGAVVTIASPHPDVGALSVVDDGNELTVHLGRFTHVHFASHERGLSADQRAERIATDTVEFIRRVLADEIEFHGTGRGGGCRPRTRAPRGLLSRFFLGSRTYLWSGPVRDTDT